MDIDIEKLMSALAASRPVFHAEADFQHALAWQVQTDHPRATVRLETRPVRGLHLDVFVNDNGHRTAIELKYLTDRFSGYLAGEHFELPRQAAHPISRHDVCKDLGRLETMVADGYADLGLAIVVSNDGAWRAGTKEDPIDVLFRLDHGRRIAGTLEWAASAGLGTTRKRTEPIRLRSSYECLWRPYSRIRQSNGRDAEFRYLSFIVTRTPPSGAR